MCKMERKLRQSSTGEVTRADPGQRLGSKEERSVKDQDGQVGITRCLKGRCGDGEGVKVASQISDLATCFTDYSKIYRKRSKSEKGRK